MTRKDVRQFVPMIKPYTDGEEPFFSACKIKIAFIIFTLLQDILYKYLQSQGRRGKKANGKR